MSEVVNGINFLSKASLLCKFDRIAEEKKLTGKDLRKEANIFHALAIKSGHTNCVFPEWLIKFHKGEWDGQ